MRNLGAAAAEGYGMTAISAARSRPLDLTAAIEASHLFQVRKCGLDAVAQARTGDVIHLALSASTESGPGGHTRGSVYAARGGDR